jgi:hypothetical protein
MYKFAAASAQSSLIHDAIYAWRVWIGFAAGRNPAVEERRTFGFLLKPQRGFTAFHADGGPRSRCSASSEIGPEVSSSIGSFPHVSAAHLSIASV